MSKFVERVRRCIDLSGASDDLLRVSAGLRSVLTLLALQSDDIADCMGLHALLLPLKEQIDNNADRLQALVV